MFRAIPLLLLLLASCGDRAVPASPDGPSTRPDYARIEKELRAAMGRQDLEGSYDLFVQLLGPPRDSREWSGGQDEIHVNPDEATVAHDVPLLREAFSEAVMDRILDLSSDPHTNDETTAWWKRLEVLGHPTITSPELLFRYLSLARYLALARLADTELGLKPHAGPQIAVVCDHFALGEAVLESMLRRWQREHREQGLRISVVPLTAPGRGLRVGMRRVPTQTTAQEVEAIHNRARELGLTPARPLPTDPLWVGAGGDNMKLNFLLFCDREGRIVARLSGLLLDPTAFEETVQRLVTR